MVDILTPAQRSFNMSRIKGKNTTPEITVRSLLRSLGYTYRLHVRNLPGCPDIVLSKHRAVIFVHGCFWHMHKCRFGKVTPQTNAEFWQQKRMSNVERDKRHRRTLRKKWSVLTVWECETRHENRLSNKLSTFLSALTA
jgi:DNA mismatch endonuclease (patch repair protein)